MNLENIFDKSGIETKILDLEDRSSAADFWLDAKEAQKVLKELSDLKNKIAPLNELSVKLEDIKIMCELIEDEDSEEAKELETHLKEAQKIYNKLETASYLSGEHDGCSAILDINSGAGGTEACDWVDMLLRMYTRYAERNGYKIEIMNIVPGDVAGTKSVTILIDGKNAYGYLRREKGVHRLVRISPFDSNKRRHTSFAAVDIIPDLEDTTTLEINPDDIKIDTYRASGAGGQHVNKTDSAVRITHIPSNIVVTCQNERSQHKNKDMAMKILTSRLYELAQAENEQKMAEIRGDVRAIEWGNQIRSYVFQPYTLVKDHRTNFEVGDVIRVMDGEIDDFIEINLKNLK